MLNTDLTMQKLFGKGVKGKRSPGVNQENACEKEIDKITAKVPHNPIKIHLQYC